MIVVYILILLVSFYILAKVVDDYFVESLDEIASKLKMSSDAAGATLMAVGSSAPELFVAIFALIRPDGSHEAIGIGNIVGSALFNILAITGAAAFVRKAVIAWQSVVRDLFFYIISIVMLLVTLYDGKITIYEALLFLAVYGIYVFVVVFWKKMFKYSDPGETKEDQKINTKTKNSFFQKIMFPFDLLLRIIYPKKKYYWATFFISILIIAGISWVLVDSAVYISHILHIPEIIIAVTVLAIGTSVPDLLSSVIVAKQGRGGMAISNAVGSNIFDILVGLGLPFLVIVLSTGGEMNLDVAGLQLSVYFLLASVFIVFVLFILNKWKVGKLFGLVLILFYLTYVIWAILSM